MNIFSMVVFNGEVIKKHLNENGKFTDSEHCRTDLDLLDLSVEKYYVKVI